MSRPPTPPAGTEKVVAPLNPLSRPTTPTANSIAAGLAGWQTVTGQKGGKGVKGGNGNKGGKGDSKPDVCYTCHLQGRDWHHNFWDCEHHKKFAGWKVQLQKGVVL